MAADILLYDTNLVPVGDDQKQHIELTRDLAIRMNNAYGDLFVVPEGYFPKVGARVMSLQDPTSKMSKTDPDPNSCIYLNDSDDVITKKIKRAVTDSGSEITYDDAKPGVKNLIGIQAAITGRAPSEIVASYAGKQYGHLKVGTAEVVAQAVKPIREKAQHLLGDLAYLDQILARGAERARTRAQKKLDLVGERVGFLRRR
jgi:tryptophanyl-tRNA synthetase